MARRANASRQAVPSPEQLERERKVLELRQAGVDFATIAEQVGYTHKGSAKRAYDRALARVHYPSAMEARELELTRLDRLQRAHWVKALQGDTDATPTRRMRDAGATSTRRPRGRCATPTRRMRVTRSAGVPRGWTKDARVGGYIARTLARLGECRKGKEAEYL